MARKKRIWYEGACYHVMGRGIRHGAIFKDDEDYRLFLMTLEKIRERYPYDLHAFCLMTNHYHLELTTKKDPIWKIMQLLMNYYARTFNHKHHYDGHLFDSRYASCLIENDPYFLEVSRYIHLNPVKATMVRDPINYKYSSYKYYISDDNGPEKQLLDTSRVLSSFGHHPNEQYRMYVEGKISHAEQELLIQKDIGENDLWLPW